MVTAKQESQIAKRIGRSLAKKRLAKNLTQEQVAESIGVEQETISRFERGTTIPPLLRLLDLAELYGTPLDEFVRAGSTRAIDQSIDVVIGLNSLKEEDRVWAVEMFSEMCHRISRRK